MTDRLCVSGGVSRGRVRYQPALLSSYIIEPNNKASYRIQLCYLKHIKYDPFRDQYEPAKTKVKVFMSFTEKKFD